MSISQLRNANLGRSKADLATVGYTLVNSDGSEQAPRTTVGVYQVVTGSGLYAVEATFPDSFQGSIVWDTGETVPAFAMEEVDVSSLSLLTNISSSVALSSDDLAFIKSIEGGRWKIDSVTSKMTFYEDDNTTPVAVFDLFDSNGAPTTNNPFERTRTG